MRTPLARLRASRAPQARTAKRQLRQQSSAMLAPPRMRRSNPPARTASLATLVRLAHQLKRHAQLARGQTPHRRPTSARFAWPLHIKTRRNRRAATRVLLDRRAPRAAQSQVHVTRAATRQAAQASVPAVLLASTRKHRELPAASMRTQATTHSPALRRSSRAAWGPLRRLLGRRLVPHAQQGRINQPQASRAVVLAVQDLIAQPRRSSHAAPALSPRLLA